MIRRPKKERGDKSTAAVVLVAKKQRRRTHPQSTTGDDASQSRGTRTTRVQDMKEPQRMTTQIGNQASNGKKQQRAAKAKAKKEEKAETAEDTKERNELKSQIKKELQNELKVHPPPKPEQFRLSRQNLNKHQEGHPAAPVAGVPKEICYKGEEGILRDSAPHEKLWY